MNYDKAFFDAKLAELPLELVKKAVRFLEMFLSEETKTGIMKLHAERGDEWAVPLHFFWGMAIRNALRDNGLGDDVLPDKNWDDYYIQLVEIACGIRPMPEEAL